MTPSGMTLSQLLQSAETGSEPRYADYPVVVGASSEGRDVFVVSDLHLASGTGGDGTFPGTENFFADGSFLRFLRHAAGGAKGRKALLIINGDFIDFLRIVLLPDSAEDFTAWETFLGRLGIQKTVAELRRSISSKERTYGLRTNDYKSVWKLSAAVSGHPVFFDALAEWVQKGHRLIVLKGNHDLEWYWPAVRNALRLKLAERISGASDGPKFLNALSEFVVPNVQFVGHAMLLDEHVYLEHGHMYDKFSHVVGEPTLGKRNHEELNIPFGSFFNRYLINQVELDFPFFDNIRPQTSLLPLLFRERFFLGLKVLFVHVPFLLRTIRKGYYEYMLKRAIFFALGIGIPGILVLVEAWNILSGTFSHFSGGAPESPIVEFLKTQGLNALLGLLGASVSYGLGRLVAWLELDEPGSLNVFAAEKFRQQPGYRLITFGHTHNPDQFVVPGAAERPDRWFYNTGTWVPVIETSSASVREDLTYIYLHMKNMKGRLQPALLQRWDDEAGRGAPLVIVRPKDQS